MTAVTKVPASMMITQTYQAGQPAVSNTQVKVLSKGFDKRLATSDKRPTVKQGMSLRHVHPGVGCGCDVKPTGKGIALIRTVLMRTPRQALEVVDRRLHMHHDGDASRRAGRLEPATIWHSPGSWNLHRRPLALACPCPSPDTVAEVATAVESLLAGCVSCSSDCVICHHTAFSV